MLPISSRRPVSGTSERVSLRETSSMTSFRRLIGRLIDRPIAMAAASVAMAAIAVMITVIISEALYFAARSSA
ncbi:hypothetical protein D3C72_2006830 [compost metagenome]